MSNLAIEVTSVSHRYGSTVALSDVSFAVAKGSLTGLLGPNGSGKTTLFRLLATLLPIQTGNVSILGKDVTDQAAEVREKLGVTFQSPALDGRLTVEENLRCHGQLYGIKRQTLTQRIDAVVQRLDLSGRRVDRVEQLSGGLRRRVELAKGLLHRPEILLLDEPSTGLDVLARRTFWDLINDVRQSDGTTVIVSTHLMDEAERCDQLFLLNEGQVVQSGTPTELQRCVEGERLTIRCRDTSPVQSAVQSLYDVVPVVQGDSVTVRVNGAAEKLSLLLDQLGDKVLSLEVAQASLDDVFVELTGRSLENIAVD